MTTHLTSVKLFLFLIIFAIFYFESFGNEINIELPEVEVVNQEAPNVHPHEINIEFPEVKVVNQEAKNVHPHKVHKDPFSGYRRVSPPSPTAIWKSLDGMTPGVVPSAMESLKTLIGENRPIYCITVVGEYHSGKSSFNNAVLGEDVFLVASDIPPQTQGFEVVVLEVLIVCVCCYGLY